MTRTIPKTRQRKLLKANIKTPKTKLSSKRATKTKDGWEMTAREALQVDFVVSEI